MKTKGDRPKQKQPPAPTQRLEQIQEQWRRWRRSLDDLCHNCGHQRSFHWHTLEFCTHSPCPCEKFQEPRS